MKVFGAGAPALRTLRAIAGGSLANTLNGRVTRIADKSDQDFSRPLDCRRDW
jgi:hypothetical protein